jgi:hypothetical protein
LVRASSPEPKAAVSSVTFGYCSLNGSITSGIKESSNAKTRSVPEGSPGALDTLPAEPLELESEHATVIIASAATTANGRMMVRIKLSLLVMPP